MRADGESLAGNLLQSNIKQRLGSELLMNYVNQFNITQDTNLIIIRLLNLYNSNEYVTLLHEAYTLLARNSSNADKLYANIVGAIEVDPFEPILVAVNNEKNIEFDVNPISA